MIYQVCKYLIMVGIKLILSIVSLLSFLSPKPTAYLPRLTRFFGFTPRIYGLFILTAMTDHTCQKQSALDISNQIYFSQTTDISK